MIYIRKQKPDRDILDKIAEVKNSPEWKMASENDTKAIRQCFDRLPKDSINFTVTITKGAGNTRDEIVFDYSLTIPKLPTPATP